MKELPLNGKSYLRKVLCLAIVLKMIMACMHGYAFTFQNKNKSEARIAIIVIEVSDRTILSNYFEMNEYGLNSRPKENEEIRLSDALNVSFGTNLLNSAIATGVTINTINQRGFVNLANNQTQYDIDIEISKKFGDIYGLNLNCQIKNAQEYGFSVNGTPVSMDGRLQLLTSVVDDYGPVNPIVIVAMKKIKKYNTPEGSTIKNHPENMDALIPPPE